MYTAIIYYNIIANKAGSNTEDPQRLLLNSETLRDDIYGTGLSMLKRLNMELISTDKVS